MEPFARETEPIAIPWGGQGERLTLNLPGGWPRPETVWPDLSGILSDYPRALGEALASPLGCGRIEDQVSAGSRVAIVVDDPSRWTPVKEALPLLLDRLRAAGVNDRDIKIVAGVGRHHPLDEAGFRGRVGAEVFERYPCLSPPVDKLSEYVNLGITPGGVPVRVYRPVAEADLRILVGSVLPHLQAGFGGGYKLIFPGTSHRSTLGALHRKGIGPGADAGRLLGGESGTNPMRIAIGEAARLLGPCLSISHLLGAPGQVLSVKAGRPEPVQEELSREARRRFRAPEAALADLVVAGNHPWPGDPMQSFKVLLQHRAACRAGGVLVGFFWTESHEIDRSFPLPAMKLIAATGTLGGWALRRGLKLADRAAAALGSPAAFMVHWARELVVDRTVLVYAPLLFDKIGPTLGPVRLFGNQKTLWRAAENALGTEIAPQVRVFPQGGLTYVSAK